MRKTADQCSTMEEIRAEIDRIDEALMTLFRERWDYIGRAGVIKSGLALPADIPERVDEVRANARARAARHGLDPAFYDDIWSRLIRHSIDHEKALLGEDR